MEDNWQEQVEPYLNVLHALVAAGHSDRHQNLHPAKLSPAAVEASTDGEEGVELRAYVRQAHLAVGHFLYAAESHVLSAITLYGSSTHVPVYSDEVLLRSALEALSLAHWLGDPSIGALGRAIRYNNLRLRSYFEKGRLPGVDFDPQPNFDEIFEWAFRNEVDRNQNEKRKTAPFLTDKGVPNSTCLAESLLADEADGFAMGRFSFKFWSASAHSTLYALHQSITVTGERNQRGEPIAEISLRADKVSADLVQIGLAYIVAVDSWHSFNGWSGDDWNDAVLDVNSLVERLRCDLGQDEPDASLL